MRGLEFKTIREQLGLTQDELSEILCLSGKKVVSNIEREVRNPSKLSAVLLRYLDKLPKVKSNELQTRLKLLSKQYDLEMKKKS